MYKHDFSNEYKTLSNLGKLVQDLIDKSDISHLDRGLYQKLLSLGKYLEYFPFNENRTKYELGEVIITLSQTFKLASCIVSSKIRIMFVRTCNRLINNLVTAHNNISY